MTGFLGNNALATQLLQSDEEQTNSPNFIWARVASVPICDDYLWPRSRLSQGGGLGLFTANLDNSRPTWDWYAWVSVGGFAAVGQRYHSISGFTRDQNGAIVTGAVVDMFRTVGDVKIGNTVSDAVTGAFTVTGLNDAETVYLVAYDVASPDIFGTTVNTLVTSYSG